MSPDGRLYLFAISLVVLAHHVATLRPSMRAVARLLLLGVGCDLVRRVIRQHVLEPWITLHGDAPLAGWIRVAGHVSQGLFLAWGAGVLALCVWTFTERRSWPVAGVVGMGTWIGAMLDYPALRQEALGRYYRGWTIALVVLSGLCVARFLIQRGRPGQEHVAAVWILAIEASLLLGPYLRSPFTGWWTAQIAYAVMYVVLIPVLAWGSVWKRIS